MSRNLGARTVQENRNSDLNIALARATVVAKTYATRGVLILPVDLPLITPEDVQAMLDKVGEPPVVIVAPDRCDNPEDLELVAQGLTTQVNAGNSFE